jgi:hypothetical protein
VGTVHNFYSLNYSIFVAVNPLLHFLSSFRIHSFSVVYRNAACLLRHTNKTDIVQLEFGKKEINEARSGLRGEPVGQLPGAATNEGR